MELIVKMDLHEATLAMNAGTLQALCTSLTKPEDLSTPEADETTKGGIDFEKAARDMEAKARQEAEEKRKAAAAAAKKAKAEAAAEEEDPAEEPALEETDEPTPFDGKTYTLEEVRATLAGLNKKGKAKEVKQIIESFGASKLTEVPKTQYAALMAKAAEV